jgi:hypothetical protein
MTMHNTPNPAAHPDALLQQADMACAYLASRLPPDQPFSVADIAVALHLRQARAYAVIRRLVKDGRAEVSAPRKGPIAGLWRPADKAPSAKPRKPATATDQMWSAMRAMASFSPTSLANHADVGSADVTVEAARTYCRALMQAGYLRVIRRAGAGNEAVYRLLKRSGPTAPILRRIQAIVDRNTDETIVLKGGAV